MAHDNQDVTFYHSPFSRGRTVHWMLEELGIPYTLKVLDFEKGDHKKPDYLALNPMGKIPTLVHGDTVVTEVAAIVMYLADTFSYGNLAPKLDDPRRGAYLRWFFFGANCVEPALADKAFNRPPVERKSSIGYGSYEDTLATLEKVVGGGQWILGESFTALDVSLGGLVNYGLFAKSLEPRPAFTEYSARLQARPALQRSNAFNNDFIQKAMAAKAAAAGGASGSAAH